MTRRTVLPKVAQAIVALCCVCGTRRTTGTVRRPDRISEPDWAEYQAGAARCLIDLKCATCGCVTQHAYLRGGEHPDAFEGKIAEYQAEQQLRDHLGDALVEVEGTCGQTLEGWGEGIRRSVELLLALRDAGTLVTFSAATTGMYRGKMQIQHYPQAGDYMLTVYGTLDPGTLESGLLDAHHRIIDREPSTGWTVWPAGSRDGSEEAVLVAVLIEV